MRKKEIQESRAGLRGDDRLCLQGGLSVCKNGLGSESGFTESLDFLLELAEHEFDATMVYVAIGDAITRLIYLSQNTVCEAIKYVQNKNSNSLFIDGVLRAIATQKTTPDEQDINRLIEFAQDKETPENNRTWIASASAEWHQNMNVEPFLNHCLNSDNQQTKRAAEAALNKKPIKWSIL